MDRTPSLIISILAGGAAGAGETICTYPAEYIKTCRQLPPMSTASNALLASQAPRAKTSLQLLHNTIRTTGVRGLYTGCSALVCSNAAKGGIRFITFTQSQALFKESSFGASNPGLSTVLAGLAAGVTESVLVVTPGEAVKTKIIHDRSVAGAGRLGLTNLNLVQATQRIVEIDGLRSLWNGLGPVLCKQGTNSAVRFATFGWAQDQIRTSWGITGMGATLAAGAVSGVITTYASMPFDNIKTRMQGLGSTKHVGMCEMALQMLRYEGVMVFWRATTPRLVRLTMSSAIAFTIFNQAVDVAAWCEQQRLHQLYPTGKDDTM